MVYAPKDPNTISWSTADTGLDLAVDIDDRTIRGIGFVRDSREVAECWLC